MYSGIAPPMNGLKQAFQLPRSQYHGGRTGRKPPFLGPAQPANTLKLVTNKRYYYSDKGRLDCVDMNERRILSTFARLYYPSNYILSADISTEQI